MFNDEAIAELSHSEYWDQRYLSEQKILVQDGPQSILHTYEWFRDFNQLRPFLEKFLAPYSTECHILHLGCGNSSLTADLHALGYTNQTSVDFSEVVIDSMKLKYSDLEEATWLVMDVRDLQLPDNSVDVAIDKGTLDVMMHGSVWDPPPDVLSNVGKYVDQVARVLKPGGKWIYITYRQPHFVKPMLDRKDLWDLTVEAPGASCGGGEFEYFGFLMKRHEAPCPEIYNDDGKGNGYLHAT